MLSLLVNGTAVPVDAAPGESLLTVLREYPIATFRDAPRSIEVLFVGDDSTPSSGLGEPPAVPIAPAIANAVFRASGRRVRELPIHLRARE